MKTKTYRNNPSPTGVTYCQGCGRTECNLTPLQDPQCPTLRGAVRWLCDPCIPSWERDKWSKKVA